jgi:geranylgeranyl reductase family protein
VSVVCRFDVAVIGAGPAGSRLAHLLSQRGARVALIDGSHPREKPCGGGVTGRAISLVGDVFRAPEAIGAVTIREARFVQASKGTAVTVPLDVAGAGALTVVSRTTFDGLLLAAARDAGARLVASRARAFTRSRGGTWHIDMANGERCEAGVLVGADGANSLVRRRVTRPFRPDQLSIATGFFAHGVSGRDILIEFTADPPGYIWSFPRPDHLAIGICAQAGGAVTARTLRVRAAQWIAATGIARGAALQPYAWPIPSLSPGDLDALDVAGPGWMLLGDAAGLVDPITREGIFFALQSASSAAAALSSSSGASDPARTFRERVRADILEELERASRVKARFFDSRFIRLMLQSLEQSARIRRVMADLITGAQSYRTLEWRLARTLEFGLAWKLLAESWTGRTTAARPVASE